MPEIAWIVVVGVSTTVVSAPPPRTWIEWPSLLMNMPCTDVLWALAKTGAARSAVEIAVRLASLEILDFIVFLLWVGRSKSQ